IASPWSRGGCVCSQVFDHTSVLQFLERLLTPKTGRPVPEPNINARRRARCGDLTAALQPPREGKGGLAAFPPPRALLQGNHPAGFKPPPAGYRALTRDEIEAIRRDPRASRLLPRQEAGVRRSCPLPYELTVDGTLSDDRTRFTIHFEAGKDVFGERSAG